MIVFILQNIKEEQLSESRQFSKLHQSESNSSVNSISALFDIVKTYDKDFNPKPANPLFLNKNGTPKVMYHQTSNDFTVFNTNNERAGKNDSETPTGMFFQPNDNDIIIMMI